MFGERGLTKHDFSLYDELLQVPLVIKPPDSTDIEVPQRLSGLTSLVDLYPTILSLVGASSPESPYSRDLLADPDASHDHVFAEIGEKPIDHIKRRHPEFEGSAYNGPMQSVRDEQHKLIVSTDRVELHNWIDDPHETTDLSEERPEIAERLRSVLNNVLADLDASGEDEELNDERLERQLKDLGYL
jgi:arylsulfatase A-like enzyme